MKELNRKCCHSVVATSEQLSNKDGRYFVTENFMTNALIFDMGRFEKLNYYEYCTHT